MYNECFSTYIKQQYECLATYVKARVISFSPEQPALGHSIKQNIRNVFVDSNTPQDHRPKVRIVIRGEINRLQGKQGARIISTAPHHQNQKHHTIQKLHEKQVTAFESILHNFIQRAQLYYNVECVVFHITFHITFHRCYIQHVNEIVLKYKKKLPTIVIFTPITHIIRQERKVRTRPQPSRILFVHLTTL